MILAYHAHGSRIHGRGLFAGRAGRAGSIVFSPEWGATQHAGFNHSCAPNMRWVGPVGGRDQWVLTRDVSQGEELTLDFRAFGSTPEFLCGYVGTGCLCPVCNP